MWLIWSRTYTRDLLEPKSESAAIILLSVSHYLYNIQRLVKLSEKKRFFFSPPVPEKLQMVASEGKRVSFL